MKEAVTLKRRKGHGEFFRFCCSREHERSGHVCARIRGAIGNELDTHLIALSDGHRVRGILSGGRVIERAGDRLVRTVHADGADIGAAYCAGRDALPYVEVAEDSGARHADFELVRLRGAVAGCEIGSAVGRDRAEAAELEQELVRHERSPLTFLPRFLADGYKSAHSKSVAQRASSFDAPSTSPLTAPNFSFARYVTPPATSTPVSTVRHCIDAVTRSARSTERMRAMR
jgi:hypothetical protein